MDDAVGFTEPAGVERVVEAGRPVEGVAVGGHRVEEGLRPAEGRVDADLGHRSAVVAAAPARGGRQPLGVQLGSVVGSTSAEGRDLQPRPIPQQHADRGVPRLRREIDPHRRRRHPVGTYPESERTLSGFGLTLPTIVTKIDFVTIPTQDPERSRSFYLDTLGFRPDEHARFDVWAGDTCFAIWAPENMGWPFAPQENGTPALHVDDVHAARAELEGKGIAFQGETIDTGVCHIALFADPDGNSLMLHGRYAPYE